MGLAARDRARLIAPLNKTMDRADLDLPRAREIRAELDALIVHMNGRGLEMSNWYGRLEMTPGMRRVDAANRGPDYEPLPDAADDRRFPWFLYWEIAWLVMNNRFQPGERLLDLGGSSSLFSCYMASKGLEVVAVDLNPELVANGDRLAADTGWSLRNMRMDLRGLDPGELGGPFHHVTSVCVFEHVPLSGRIEVGRRIRELLVDGGSLSMTFDYLNPAPQARINSPADVQAQFVEPSGLEVRGNRELHDNGLRYLVHPAHAAIVRGAFARERPGDYTFGALFQERA